MENLWSDIRFGVRNLRKTRGLTAVAVITLALGIGANTAIFSVINAVLLRPLPFRDPGQLVRMFETESAPGNYPFSPPDFIDWKTQNHTFQDMTIYGWSHDINLSDAGRSEHVVAMPTEANFFELLGQKPLLGRTWAAGEDEPGNDQVCILSYALWQAQFGGDKNVIGRTIDLNAKPHKVIGVMPPGFRYPSSAQMWTPFDMDTKSLGTRGNHWASVIGRLKPGVTLQQAQAEMSLIAKRLEQQYPDSNYKIGASLLPMHEAMVSDSRDSLMIMLWAVALVLLIACANVANLLLSRSVARQKEMAIRSALGAARARLVRQLLTESVVLGIIGSLLGLVVAFAGVKLLASLKHLGLPATNPIELSLPVLAFTLGIAVLSGLLFGIFPAVHLSRPDLHDELKGGAGSSTSPSRRRRLTSDLLVVGEIGLSLLLLISAGLLLKDFLRLRDSNVGVRVEGVWTAAIQLPEAKYKEDPQQFAFWQSLLERVRHVPGVESAAVTSVLPLEGGNNSYVKVRGSSARREESPLVENHLVSPGYFYTMGIPLLQGRDFTAQDIEATTAVNARLHDLYEKTKTPPPEVLNTIVYPAVINESMARHFWPKQSPLGQMFTNDSENGPWGQVIGVVGDTKQWGLTHEPVPEQYDAVAGGSRLFLVIHATVAPHSITGAVRHQVAELDSSLPLFDVRTMNDVITEDAAGQQVYTLLLGIFAALALVLAAVGIYGVLSYAVTQRTREIGIRMSLGARHGDVLRLVLGHGARLAIAGFVIGVIGAIAARRVLASSLHMIRPMDPGIYIATIACLAAVALLACYVPARRAARVDPVIALRHE
jgi:putative ABC transport system permease protein